jgi:flagellar motor protein MotB
MEATNEISSPVKKKGGRHLLWSFNSRIFLVAKRAQLRDRFAGQQVEILRLKDSTVIRVGNAVFFEIGSADIKPSAQPILDTIGRVLADNLKRNVRVEGHTDNVPIGLVLSQAYPSNWELSVAQPNPSVGQSRT